MPILANIFDVDELSTWEEYTLDDEGWFDEFILNVFTTTKDKKQKVFDAIKSTSFLTNINEEWKKNASDGMAWSKGFPGIGNASDPVAKEILGKKILLLALKL